MENVPNIGNQEPVRQTGRVEAGDVGGVNRVYPVGGDVAGIRREVAEPVVFPLIGQAVDIAVISAVVERIGNFDGVHEERIGGAFGDF